MWNFIQTVSTFLSFPSLLPSPSYFSHFFTVNGGLMRTFVLIVLGFLALFLPPFDQMVFTQKCSATLSRSLFFSSSFSLFFCLSHCNSAILNSPLTPMLNFQGVFTAGVRLNVRGYKFLVTFAKSPGDRCRRRHRRRRRRLSIFLIFSLFSYFHAIQLNICLCPMKAGRFHPPLPFKWFPARQFWLQLTRIWPHGESNGPDLREFFIHSLNATRLSILFFFIFSFLQNFSLPLVSSTSTLTFWGFTVRLWKQQLIHPARACSTGRGLLLFFAPLSPLLCLCLCLCLSVSLSLFSFLISLSSLLLFFSELTLVWITSSSSDAHVESTQQPLSAHPFQSLIASIAIKLHCTRSNILNYFIQ